MPLFIVKQKDGSNIDIADGIKLDIQGLKIIGDNVVDWNEPIQQNFMILSNAILNNKDEFDTMKTSVETSQSSASDEFSSIHQTLLQKANSSSVYDRDTMDTLLNGKSDVMHSHNQYVTATDIDTALALKQNVLTAGTNITINNGVISANDTSIDWSEITSKPSNVSSFTNDAGYQTASQVQTLVSSAVPNIDLSAYYTKAEIGTISDLLAQL